MNAAKKSADGGKLLAQAREAAKDRLAVEVAQLFARRAASRWVMGDRWNRWSGSAVCAEVR